MLSPDQAAALGDIGGALVDLGEGVRRFAATFNAPEPDSPVVNLDASEVETLWKRLGSGNRYFLIACARAFKPGEPFTLEQMAEAADAAPGSVKARLMNIGRSLKAMGNDFTVLWDSEWGMLEMRYLWRPVAHSVIIGKATE
jgi:hypothetical protein